MVWLGIDHNISQHRLWKDISVGFGVYGTHDINRAIIILLDNDNRILNETFKFFW